MRRPTSARLADLHRADAWPFVTWCFAEGHVRPDLELLLAKPAGVDLPAAWAARFPDDVRALERAAKALGWSANWARQVTRLAASSFCLHLGKQIEQVTDDDFDAVLAELDSLACASPSAREHFARRLFSLRHACYQLGAVSVPPRKGPPARTPAQRAAEIAQAHIRAEVLRYVTTISTTLRPTTVAGRTKALMVFFGYLAEHHPEVQRLSQIDRPRTSSPISPGRGTGPGAARAVAAGPSAWSSTTRTSWTCAASSRTSSTGAGHRRRAGACCSSPTSRACPSPCRGRCRRTPTGR